jgi:hypothetical protein
VNPPAPVRVAAVVPAAAGMATLIGAAPTAPPEKERLPMVEPVIA